MSEPDEPEADEYVVEFDDGVEVNVTDLVDEYHLSADRKVQLDQYEPISEHVSLGGEFPDEMNLTPDERLSIIMETAQLARDICEANVMRRYEEYVRKEAFGDD